MPQQLGDEVIQVNYQGIASALTARPKTFSTGSTGNMVFGRVIGPDGSQYQFTGNMVRIGSNPNKGVAVKGKKPHTAKSAV